MSWICYLIESVSLVVVQQGAVNVFDRVRFCVDVRKVGVRVDLQHVDAISEDSSEHNMTDLFHVVGYESVDFGLFHRCVVFTTEVFLPGFWVAAVTATATIRRRHFVLVCSMRRFLETTRAQHTSWIHTALAATVSWLAILEDVSTD